MIQKYVKNLFNEVLPLKPSWQMTANQEKIYLEKLSAGWKANKSIDKHPMHIKCELPWNGNLYLWIAALTDQWIVL